jgi:superfamily II DNA helicase RecQ
VGRAGRDGSSAEAILHYNSSDISTGIKGMGESVRQYCKTSDKCRRHVISDHFKTASDKPDTDCCDVCQSNVNDTPPPTVSLEQREILRSALSQYVWTDSSSICRSLLTKQNIQLIVDCCEFLGTTESVQSLLSLPEFITHAVSEIISHTL